MAVNESDALTIARQMIQRHGMQASAVAHERETLARQEADAKALSLWVGVQRSISELRTPRPA